MNRPGRRPRVLVVHFYLRGRETDARAGRYPRSHLWGVDDLAAAGWEVELLSDQARLPPRPFLRWLSRLSRGFAGDLVQTASVLAAARRADLVYVPSGDLPLVRWARARRRLPARHVGWLYAPTRLVPWPRVRRLVQRLGDGWGFDGLCCLTRATADHVSRHFPACRAAAIDWTVDLDLQRPRPGPDDGTLLSCGKTGRDFTTLVRAAALAGRDVPVRLIAPASALAGLDLPPNCRRLGGPATPADDAGVDYAELVRHQAAARAHLVILPADPYSTNGYTSLLEACAVGRPVVATRTGLLDLDVEKEGIGWAVPPGDAPALAAVLRTVAADPAGAAERGRRARHLAETRFHPARFGAAVEGFLRSVLELREGAEA